MDITKLPKDLKEKYGFSYETHSNRNSSLKRLMHEQGRAFLNEITLHFASTTFLSERKTQNTR